MANMLEFYFRFRFSRLHLYQHVILHLPATFRANQTICNIVMASYLFSKVASTASEFYFVTSLIWEGRNLAVYQISARYLNPQLKYYYFRFLKTNNRRAGILLSVSIFRFASPLACHSASALT